VADNQPPAEEPPLAYRLMKYSQAMRISWREAAMTPWDIVESHLEMMRIEKERLG